MPDLKDNLKQLESDGSITEPSELARKMLLEFIRSAAAERGITNRQIAQVTGFRESNVSRMLAGRYSPSLDNFLKLLGALDLRIEITSQYPFGKPSTGYESRP